jgi:hypothetical protein
MPLRMDNSASWTSLLLLHIDVVRSAISHASMLTVAAINRPTKLHVQSVAHQQYTGVCSSFECALALSALCIG